MQKGERFIMEFSPRVNEDNPDPADRVRTPLRHLEFYVRCAY